jgi:hypothetical protein
VFGRYRVGILDEALNVLADVFLTPLSFLAQAGMVVHIGLLLLLLFFPIHYSLIILPFATVYTELLTASLNKLQIGQ